MGRRKTLALAAALTALVLGVAACGGDDDDDGDGGAGETSLDLQIGDVVPLTGDLSDFGPPGEKAANVAVEEVINPAIEEVGADHQVSISHEDTETDPQAAVQAARKATGEGATCLTGAYASASTIPVAESVSLRDGVLQISPASTSDEITGLDDPDGLVNRTAPPDSFQGPTLANVVEEEIGGAEGATVNVGARNDAYGTGLADTFTAAWEAKGGEIGTQTIYDPDQPSYNSEAGDIVSGNPDAIVIVDFPETYAKVGPALVRTGDFDTSKSFVTDGLASGDLPADAGSDATEGLRGTAPGSPDQGEAAEEFDRLYSEFQPQDLGRQTFDAQNFDATVLCYLSAVAAGSTDSVDMAEQVREVSSPPGDKFTFLDLAGAIEALQNGDDIDYDGASGAIDMDDAGDATAGVYDIFRFQNDEVDVFDETPVAAAGEDEGDSEEE